MKVPTSWENVRVCEECDDMLRLSEICVIFALMSSVGR